METGVIKFYLVKKGFGFITPDTDEADIKDIFFHHSGLISKDIKEGDEVSFVVQEGRKGPEAADITKI